MSKSNKIFIATSLDGFIADSKGSIDFLHEIPNPNNIDMGYSEFMSSIDAIVMGRNTFETVCSFDMDWPYQIPVFVLTNSIKKVHEKLSDKVKLVNGPLKEIVNELNKQGLHNLYIDGGSTIQSFLKEDLIDEITITTIPKLLGGGIPLFSSLSLPLDFNCVSTSIYLDKVVQNKFIRNR